MKINISATAFLSALLLSCTYAPTAIAGDGIAGDWTGESICTVRPSPCNDEHVIYHISEPDAEGKLKLRADKLVNGKPEEMGTLDCTYEAKSSHLNCQMKNGVWDFNVAGKKMTGTLKLADGTLYRRISVTRSES